MRECEWCLERRQGPPGQAAESPLRDPATGERFSYEIELVPPSGLRIVSEKKGERREPAFIPQPSPGYLHSFGLTRRYVVIVTQPWNFNLQAGQGRRQEGRVEDLARARGLPGRAGLRAAAARPVRGRRRGHDGRPRRAPPGLGPGRAGRQVDAGDRTGLGCHTTSRSASTGFTPARARSSGSSCRVRSRPPVPRRNIPRLATRPIPPSQRPRR
ncbi:MAG: carotenoid oxygenase family protein [Thermoleophilia bacterium]|nr:carotenoid oxygenase family protein [Thermoleophilia bacterium]